MSIIHTSRSGISWKRKHTAYQFLPCPARLNGMLEQSRAHARVAGVLARLGRPPLHPRRRRPHPRRHRRLAGSRQLRRSRPRTQGEAPWSETERSAAPLSHAVQASETHPTHADVCGRPLWVSSVEQQLCGASTHYRTHTALTGAWSMLTCRQVVILVKVNEGYVSDSL